jgi:C4-type Zn-finger protein
MTENIAVNQKLNSCEGCYNLSTERVNVPYFGENENVSLSCCKACQESISRNSDYPYNTIIFEYREVNDPTVKPSWCPL